MSESLKNFANRDTKYNFILLLGLLIIFAISIVNAVDFRKIAIDNDTISDTYFSVGYANILCVLNSITAFFVFVGIVYIIWKIIKGNKNIRELETNIAAINFFEAFSGPSDVFTSGTISKDAISKSAGFSKSFDNGLANFKNAFKKM